MKIAVFGGSFDPVHKEHIHVAQAAVAELGLDALFVMPAHNPPHKPWKELTSDEDRLEMCRLAFQNVPKIQISDYEIKQGGMSYTYLTCQHFRELYKKAEIFWLVGTDMLRDFPTWKNPQSILNDVTLVVCARHENGDWLHVEQEKFYQKFGKKFLTLTYNGADVSSTEIRVLAGAGMRLTEFLPKNVEAYIEKKELYKIPFADKALAFQNPLRREHSLRVGMMAAKMATKMRLPERQALTAALMHDCAKNLEKNSPYLEGFVIKEEWGDVPKPVLHQFTGAYVAERVFKVQDQEVLNAIRYHTSGRKGMTALEKLIFLADMLEEGRDFSGVETLRKLFWEETDVDVCLRAALKRSLEFIKEKGEKIYPLTEAAYKDLCENREEM